MEQSVSTEQALGFFPLDFGYSKESHGRNTSKTSVETSCIEQN